MSAEASRLTVIADAGRDARSRQRVICRCTCGGTLMVRHDHLKKGSIRSCGCLAREMTSARRKTHGKTNTRTYNIWCKLKARCLNPTNNRWADYGGRGITVCNAWRDSFERFLADMGECPPGYSIERVDNDGNYNAANCRWIPKPQQSINRRTTVWVIKGLHLAEFCRISGLNYRQARRAISGLAHHVGQKS